MSTSLNHVGISVPDIEEGIKWYTETFDISQISDVMEVFSETDQVASDVFENKFKKFKIVHMCTIDGVGVELFEFTDPKNENPENNFEFWKTGIFHIAFTTNNIEKICKKISSNGGKQRSKIWQLFKTKPYRICYCEDPWGNILELSSHPYSVIWSNYTKPHILK